ncbi:hypothetical protein V6Z12_A10G026800 [Gossypium hirsutum]
MGIDIHSVSNKVAKGRTPNSRWNSVNSGLERLRKRKTRVQSCGLTGFDCYI